MTQSCSQGDFEAVDFSLPRNSTETHAVKYKGEHLQKHKTLGFNMVTKMFHVSSLLMPKREEVWVGGVMEGGKSEREEGFVLTFAINLGH